MPPPPFDASRSSSIKLREAFRQAGIRAWDEYQATGLHLTQEEADAWLAKLEAGQDAEPPECHG